MEILIIEDNRRLAAAVARGLADEGYRVEVAHDGGSGLDRAVAGEHDAIILDLMLPELDGMTVLSRLRQRGRTTPVLILTARGELDDRVAGLDGGADDYLAKPFAFEELLARLRAIVRRGQGAASNVICIDDLEVDTLAKTVRRGGRAITLSAREYAVLEYLARRPGRTVTRDQLLDALYEPGDEPASNVIDVYIGQLRRKLDTDQQRRLIHTRRGLGYVLEVEP